MASVPKSVIDTLIAEALGEGDQGLSDVAHVIINRSQQWGMTPDQVVRQPAQFTGLSHPGASARKAQSDPQVRARVERIFSDALSGNSPDMTGEALHYYAPGGMAGGREPSWWSGTAKHGGLTRGNHVFAPTVPIPPAEIPNVVASRTDTVPPPRTPPAALPMPPMVAAKRNLQPATADVASIYDGIFPQRNLTQGNEVNRSAQAAQNAQDPALAAALQARMAPPTPMPTYGSARYATASALPPLPPADPMTAYNAARYGSTPAIPKPPTPAASPMPSPRLPDVSVQMANAAVDPVLQAHLNPPSIPGPNSPPKLGSERLLPGPIGLTVADQGVVPQPPRIMVGDVPQVATTIDVVPPAPFPPLPRPRPFHQPMAMPSPARPIQRQQPIIVQRTPLARPQTAVQQLMGGGLSPSQSYSAANALAAERARSNASRPEHRSSDWFNEVTGRG